MKPNTHDRRHSERWRAREPIALEWSSRRSEGGGHLLDISDDGIFVSGRPPGVPGEEFDVVLILGEVCVNHVATLVRVLAKDHGHLWAATFRSDTQSSLPAHVYCESCGRPCSVAREHLERGFMICGDCMRSTDSLDVVEDYERPESAS